MSPDAKGRPPFRVVLKRGMMLRWDKAIDDYRHALQWRWQAIGRNGRIVGGSTEGYFNRSDAEANLLLLTPGYTRTEAGLVNELLRETDPARFIPVEVEQ